MKNKIIDQLPALDHIIDQWRPQLAADYTAYRNHCYRVLNFCLTLCEGEAEHMEKIAIAAAFHDLGIWTDSTFDYLAPSRQRALDHLAGADKSAWSAEIEAMIEQHHKLFRYKTRPDWLVEAFRKADWVDVSRGRFRFGLPSEFVASVMNKFPNAGFHKRLLGLTRQRFMTHPFSPLPMMKF